MPNEKSTNNVNPSVDDFDALSEEDSFDDFSSNIYDYSSSVADEVDKAEREAKVQQAKNYTRTLSNISNLINEALESKPVKCLVKCIIVLFLCIIVYAIIVWSFSFVEGAKEGVTYIKIPFFDCPFNTMMHKDFATELLSVTISAVVGFFYGAILKR